jgi:hypothetical protein
MWLQLDAELAREVEGGAYQEVGLGGSWRFDRSGLCQGDEQGIEVW